MIPDKPIACCECLRSQGVYTNPVERPGRLLANDDTQVFWCVKTQSPEGPDGQAATPLTCQSPRPCYEGGPVASASPPTV